MTDSEVVAEMKSDTPLNRARQAFSNAYAEIDQADQQRVRPSICDIRRMEFAAVEKIIAAYNG
jgi:hypothetical protein